MMVWGSLYLALAFAAALLLNFGHDRRYLLLGLLIALPVFTNPRDSFLYFYALLAGTYCERASNPDVAPRHSPLVKHSLLALLFIPFGLLPLVKGSALTLCGPMAGLACALFAVRKDWKAAAAVAGWPVAALVVFWLLAGQALENLPAYFLFLSHIIFGYTGAMAREGQAWEVVAYVFITLVMLGVILANREYDFTGRLFLGLMFFLALFVAFKGGFVRHDMHATIATALLAYAAFPAARLARPKPGKAMLALALVAAAFIYQNHGFTWKRPLSNVRDIYATAWEGIRLRLGTGQGLEKKYAAAMARVQSRGKFPELQGTTDVYSYGQTFLLAAGNVWNPRPVIQSYSVYTPFLAELNRQHLLGAKAPDNLIFRVEAIDLRMPSTEDGASWPVMLANYQPTSFENETLVLRRNAAQQGEPVLAPLGGGVHEFGEAVAVPESANAVYLSVDFKPNFMGQIVNFFYKTDQPWIDLVLEDGSKRSHRLIAGMAKPEFLISPLVGTTSEFAALYGGSGLALGRRVKSFTIRHERTREFWQPQYKLHFMEQKLPA